MPPSPTPLRPQPAWVERAWPAAGADEHEADPTRAHAQLIDEIHTLLATVRSQVQLLRRRVANGDGGAAGLADGLERIEAAAARIADLLGELAALLAPGREAGEAAQRAPAEIVQLGRGSGAHGTAALVGVHAPGGSEPSGGLALSSVLEALSVVGAVRADAVRYLLNQTNAHESWQAIKAAVAGPVQFAPVPAGPPTHARRGASGWTHEALASEQLSERELDVLRLLAHGRSNKQIAHDLTIAENTVKTHVSSILGKLGVESRTQAALHARRMGLVPPGEPAATGPFAA